MTADGNRVFFETYVISNDLLDNAAGSVTMVKPFFLAAD